jgi:glycosyltransferase involved in cell wall biosynthesis
MIEAMACGTPVLARSLGSVAEVVDDGVTGHHAAEIGEMQELLPATLALDRRRVRGRAEGRFSFARMVEGYVELYGRLNAKTKSQR